MKKYAAIPIVLALLLLFFPAIYAAVDTLEGEELTSSATIEGVSTTDTVEGQVLAAGGGAAKPCTNTTTDGDGSTALDMCEMTNEDAAWAAAATWSGDENSSVVTGTQSYPCGNTKVILLDNVGSQTISWDYTDKGEMYVWVAFMVRASTSGSAAILVADSVSATDTFSIGWRSNDKIRIKHYNSANSLIEHDTPTLSEDTWYAVRIWWKANSDPGITADYTALATINWTSIDLTADDSTYDSLSKDLEFRIETDADIEVGVLKVDYTTLSGHLPDTCS